MHSEQWYLHELQEPFKGPLSSQSLDFTSTKVRAHGPWYALNEDQIKVEVNSPTGAECLPKTGI